MKAHIVTQVYLCKAAAYFAVLMSNWEEILCHKVSITAQFLGLNGTLCLLAYKLFVACLFTVVGVGCCAPALCENQTNAVRAPASCSVQCVRSCCGQLNVAWDTSHIIISYNVILIDPQRMGLQFVLGPMVFCWPRKYLGNLQLSLCVGVIKIWFV